jgi:hypothetical protein
VNVFGPAHIEKSHFKGVKIMKNVPVQAIFTDKNQ